MCCTGKWIAAIMLTAVAAWVGFNHFASAEDAKPTANAQDTKVDLTALRDAVERAADRGANVDEISKALTAFAKVAPNAKFGTVPPELQALRDAVDAAGRKGENVDAIAKELTAVEMIVAGKSLSKPRPDPRPEPRPEPRPNPVPFPIVPFPPLPDAGPLPGGIDVQMFNKAMELRRKALELMLKDPNDPEVQKEGQKLMAEAMQMLLKAAGNGGGVAPAMPLLPFPDIGRVPERARLGIRMERVPAVAAEQLGLEPNTGIAVTMVLAGSAAEKAGLKVHDIILEFAGKPVSDNTEDFIRRVNDVKAGEKIDLVVLRKGKKVEMKGVELPKVNGFRVPPQPVPLLPLPGLVPNVPNPRPNLPVNPALIKPLPVPVARPVALPPGFNNISYTSENDKFRLTAAKEATKFVVTGSFNAEGQPVFESATIEDGGETHTADALAKIPVLFQPDIEALLKTVKPRK